MVGSIPKRAASPDPTRCIELSTRLRSVPSPEESRHVDAVVLNQGLRNDFGILLHTTMCLGSASCKASASRLGPSP
jgi:hypothetical protein